MGKAIQIWDRLPAHLRSNNPMMRTIPTQIEGWITPHRISSFFSPWSRATARSVGGGGLTLASESHFDFIWIFFIFILIYDVSFVLYFFQPFFFPFSRIELAQDIIPIPSRLPLVNSF